MVIPLLIHVCRLKKKYFLTQTDRDITDMPESPLSPSSSSSLLLSSSCLFCFRLVKGQMRDVLRCLGNWTNNNRNDERDPFSLGPYRAPSRSAFPLSFLDNSSRVSLSLSLSLSVCVCVCVRNNVAQLLEHCLGWARGTKG